MWFFSGTVCIDRPADAADALPIPVGWHTNCNLLTRWSRHPGWSDHPAQEVHMSTELLLGDEAVGLAALDAGIGGVFSYPGTPATEIFEFIEARTRGSNAVAASWSANEKVAYEEALGMSLAGRRALVSMKHVGLNVAADPFINSALTGARAGLVLAVADDPGMHSSQNEQDSRIYGAFAQVPVMEPAGQQEAYDMTRAAFELSERLHLPVLVRLVTRLAHSRSAVRPSPPARPPPLDQTIDWRQWTLLPVNARRRYRHLLELQPAIREASEKSPYNRLERAGPRGIIACGIGYNYVREALGPSSNYSILKISTYPVPTGLVRRLVDHCGEILVVEEGFPYVETLLIGLLGVPGKIIRGKRSDAIPLDGELTVDRVRAALGMQAPSIEAPLELPNRPPRLCDGCPHCDSFKAILAAIDGHEQPILMSDIGCYTLGALPPYNAVHTCVDMGASISMGHGAAKAGAHPVICTIGDSTFIHSGMTGLIGAARDNANMTVVILDNATVGMTGQQETIVTGDRLVELVKALGVDPSHVFRIEPVPKNHDANAELLRREIAHRGLSVIVACRPCVQLRGRRTRSPAAATAS